jgi:hypothetical protein
MTEKTYQTIAAEIRHVRDADLTPARTWAIESVCNALAVCFARENPRFDRDKFLKACGVI